jgi:hypothetical protein
LIQNGFSATIQGNSEEKKVIVSNRVASIKIEPNYTVRGCLYTPMIQPICSKAEREYGYAEMQIISPAELYGGKICAALDRQHPRDLFDVQGLFSTAKQDLNLIDGFLAMLLGHNKPVHELLNPKPKDQAEVFEKEFFGMTDTNFSYQDHIYIFGELVQFVKEEIVPYKSFLLDFISLRPDFPALGIPNLDRMPAIRWKLQNLEKLKKSNPGKFDEQYEKLTHLFS